MNKHLTLLLFIGLLTTGCQDISHELVSHKQGLDNKYAISKTYYFQKEEQFYKQHEMLQDDLEAISIKDETLDFVFLSYFCCGCDRIVPYTHSD